MCFSVVVYYSCRGSCVGKEGDGRKPSYSVRGQRSYLKRRRHCQDVLAGRRCRRRAVQHYEYRYPMKCRACQAAWGESMRVTPAELVRLWDRLEAHVQAKGAGDGGDAEVREVRDRVRSVVDQVREVISNCNVDALDKEEKLDYELHLILGESHRVLDRLPDGQERLDGAVRPVDYARFERDREDVLENSPGFIAGRWRDPRESGAASLQGSSS